MGSIRNNFQHQMSSNHSLRIALFRVSLGIALSGVSIAYGDEAAEKLILPETVVTATRAETPLTDVGRSIEARDRADFEAQATANASEILQSIPGLRTGELGGPGAPGVTPFEMRGFRTSGTQFLLNGMRFSDPSSVGGTADSFAPWILVNSLQSIEVLKGASSMLYGSDGQAGAINFITREPEAGTFGQLSLEGGSFGTYQESASANVGTEEFGVIGDFTRIDSDGIDTHGNYENSTAFVAGLWHVNQNVTIKPIFHALSVLLDLDKGPVVSPNGELIPSEDSSSDKVDGQHYFYGVTTEYQNESNYRSKLSVYMNSADRDYLFDFGYPTDFRYQGDSFNTDWQNSIELNDWCSEIIFGGDYEHQSVDQDSPDISDSGRQDRYGAYIKQRLYLADDLLILDGGARVTHVSAIDRTLPTLEISGVLKPVAGSALHSSIAQGFRAPTLYETDGLASDFQNGEIVNVGNRNLEEERSLTFDVGLTQQLFEGAELDLTYFSAHSKETILFDFLNLTHVNGGDSNTRGLETWFKVRPTEQLQLRAGYTYLAEAEGLDGARIQRRPYNVWSADITYRTGPVTLFTELRYRGAQNLSFFGVADQLREDDAAIVNAAATYAVDPQLELYTRLNNILDENYTDSGYIMPGIGVFGGVRYKFDGTQ